MIKPLDRSFLDPLAGALDSPSGASDTGDIVVDHENERRGNPGGNENTAKEVVARKR